jgi:uncharacterized protein YidB (DUF937 family)
MAGNELGGILGGLLGGASGAPPGAGNVLGALLSSLGRNSGPGGGNPLAGLLESLSAGGLGEQAQSWIGTGENQPVSGAEIAQALPGETLDEAARESGLSPHEAADRIAEALPRVVDQLTPRGEIPSGASLEELIKQQQLG